MSEVASKCAFKLSRKMGKSLASKMGKRVWFDNALPPCSCAGDLLDAGNQCSEGALLCQYFHIRFMYGRQGTTCATLTFSPVALSDQPQAASPTIRQFQRWRDAGLPVSVLSLRSANSQIADRNTCRRERAPKLRCRACQLTWLQPEASSVQSGPQTRRQCVPQSRL